MGYGEWGDEGDEGVEVAVSFYPLPLMPNAQCPIILNPLQCVCDVSLEIDIPAE
ncbi:MAG: hypothetical protein V7L27_15740 [Nostoc sp.]|uniref:hypothetical protein n=1 Tax=Nostoc sp. TaxID=1180 RepID=UPI002FF9C870